MHKITGEYKEKRHMKRKTEQNSNLCGPMRNTKIGLNRAMPQYHSQYCNTFGNIKKSNTLHMS